MSITSKFNFFKNYCFSKKLVKSIHRKYPNNKIVFALPHLGDTVLALSYLQHLRNKPIIVAPRNLENIVRLYNDLYDDIFLISEKQAMRLFTCASCPLLFNVFAKEDIVGVPYRYIDHNLINQIDGGALYAIKFAYGLDVNKDYVQTYPLVPEIGITKIEDILQTSKSNFQHIVIISPYAQSCCSIPKSFWDALVAYLQHDGFIVYSNVTQNQIELDNTIRLQCSLIELSNICKNIRAFVGLRSGVFDFLATSSGGGLLIALYTYLESMRSYTLKQIHGGIKSCEIAYIEDANVIEQVIKSIGELTRAD